MNVIITALKAPWPVGAVLGSVVAIEGSEIPGWAAGKCKAAPEDAEVTHVFVPEEPKAVTRDAPEVVELRDELKIAQSMRDAAEHEAHELRGMLAERDAALGKANTTVADATNHIEQLHGELNAMTAERDAALAKVAEAAAKSKK